jgi:hypothetical protein
MKHDAVYYPMASDACVEQASTAKPPTCCQSDKGASMGKELPLLLHYVLSVRAKERSNAEEQMVMDDSAGCMSDCWS